MRVEGPGYATAGQRTLPGPGTWPSPHNTRSRTNRGGLDTGVGAVLGEDLPQLGFGFGRVAEGGFGGAAFEVGPVPGSD